MREWIEVCRNKLINKKVPVRVVSDIDTNNNRKTRENQVRYEKETSNFGNSSVNNGFLYSGVVERVLSFSLNCIWSIKV